MEDNSLIGENALRRSKQRLSLALKGVVRACETGSSPSELPTSMKTAKSDIQLQCLRRLRCEKSQGHYFSPPVKFDKVEKVLRIWVSGIELFHKPTRRHGLQ
jgi:EAL domain-containing protein (putative c-di-GMP-specific phosphodiesterase class I)